MSETLRQQIFEASRSPMSVKGLATRFGIPMNVVVDHLNHIAKSAKTAGYKLIWDSALCEKCEYRFTTRIRFTKPSRCPKCKDERILPPSFYWALKHEI